MLPLLRLQSRWWFVHSGRRLIIFFPKWPLKVDIIRRVVEDASDRLRTIFAWFMSFETSLKFRSAE